MKELTLLLVLLFNTSNINSDVIIPYGYDVIYNPWENIYSWVQIDESSEIIEYSHSDFDTQQQAISDIYEHKKNQNRDPGYWIRLNCKTYLTKKVQR